MTDDAGGRREPVATFADSFRELQRMVRRAKARHQAAAKNDVESATHMLLHTVAAEGPMRSSALATSVQSDLSTVSRQVTALVGRGLLERQADQGDGRASLLALTGAGRAALADYERQRQAFFDAVLADWSIEEMRQFTRQLDRLTTAYDDVHIALVCGRPRPPDSRSAAPARTRTHGNPPNSEEGTTA
jgi:DNA-binding MarR family transcriptional regulator